jgi:hypothetical protein
VADTYNNIGVVYEEKGDLENALLQHQRLTTVNCAHIVHYFEHRLPPFVFFIPM